MNTEAIAAQLVSIKAQLAAIEAVVDAALMMMVGGCIDPVTECQHPPEDREPIPAMGGVTRWRCKACGYLFNGEVRT